MSEEHNPLSSSEFISKIIQDADTGSSFVPLIGSGLSSPSGIIMGMEFGNYLAFATYLVLADPSTRPKTYGEGSPKRWDLVQKGWPPLPSAEEVNQATGWIKREFTKLCERLSLDINYDDPRDSGRSRIKSVVAKRGASTSFDLRLAFTYPRIPWILRSDQAESIDDYLRRLIDLLARDATKGQYVGSFDIDELVPDPTRSYHSRIIEMGIRALHDWRETLVFLSIAGIDKSENGRLYKKERDSSVIDAFNTFITRDKQPNLGHKILAHLSSPLRIQTTLTTNFDTLTEDAYRALSLSLRVLPVSARGRLPEARTVASEDSLVKLHGEAQDTRADLSLDDEPLDADKQTFAAYLTRGAGNLSSSKQLYHDETLSLSKRLMIIGYSGSDYRCVQMIRHWLEVAKDAIVYWICFSLSDMKHVNKLFSDPIYRNKIRMTQSSRPDLMLYELYQRLVLSLPPGGLTYEFAHIVPPRRLKPYDHSEEQVRNALQCGLESRNPLEASRVLLGDSGTAIDARRLARDAVVLRLKQRLIEAVNSTLSFYKPSGEIRNSEEVEDHFVKFSQWIPKYRNATIERMPRLDDEKAYKELKQRPVVFDAPSGVVRASALAFEELARRGKKVFWIETQDYMDADGLLRDFHRGLALRFGAFQSRHVTLHPLPMPIVEAASSYASPVDGKSPLSEEDSWVKVCVEISQHLTKVLDEYRADPGSIVVIVYGRDGYGACSGLFPANWHVNDPSFKALHCVLEALARAGVKVLYFPLTKRRAENKERATKDWIVKLPDMPEQHPNAFSSFQSKEQDWFALVEAKDTNADSELSRSLWAYDPYLEKSFEDQDLSLPLFKVIVTKVLAPFFTYDSNEATTLTPRFERIANEKKLVFLYALTLFRHSRNPNSLCSEAVFQCPFRHNANAIDNDFVRAEEAADWISELREARVFFDKPGGSIWMHRDIRLTIQRILEQTPLRNPTSGKVDRRNDHFSEARSRLHFWIGDWYFKAFCSSGHINPVLESLHHRLMAAKFATQATPKISESEKDTNEKNFWSYRFIIFESAILEASKTILIAWQWLHLWQACSFDASWLTVQHQQRIRKELEIPLSIFREKLPFVFPYGESGQMLERLERATKQLLKLLSSLAQQLTLEGGGASKQTTPSLDPYSCSLLGSTPAPVEDDESRADLMLDHGLDMIRKPQEPFEAEIAKRFSCFKPSDGDVSVWDCIKNLSIKSASRDQKDQYVTALSVTKAIWKRKNLYHANSLHQMIWLLGETAYTLLRRAKLSFHATHSIDIESWLMASTACNLGVDLCKHLPCSLLDFEIHSRTKLHTLYSVALANLGRFFEANRHLNEAQALLSKSRVQYKSDYAILCLRRAEVRLTECFWIKQFLQTDKNSLTIENTTLSSRPGSALEYVTVSSPSMQRLFGVSRMFLVDGKRPTSWSMQAIREILDAQGRDKTMFIPPRIGECFRKSLHLERDKWMTQSQDLLKRLYNATLDEAIALLDQGERLLSGNSQSTLWWSRLHTLRLRVYGMLEVLGPDLAATSLCLRKHSPDMGIYYNYCNAYRISMHDKFRQLRAIKYFLDANHWHCRFEDRHNKDLPPLATLLPDSLKESKQAYHRILKGLDENVLGEYAQLQSALKQHEESNNEEAKKQTLAQMLLWKKLHLFEASVLNVGAEYSIEPPT